MYAIQHGATVIYESDDDNILAQDSVIYVPEYETMAQISGPSGVVNPYAYFGVPQSWPRGFPLELLKERADFTFINTTEKKLFIPVQQGLADLDPDLDALYRLIYTDQIGKIRFDKSKAPVAIKPTAMTPFNTQNTSNKKSKHILFLCDFSSNIFSCA